uniref:Nicotianamine synthase n=1 Tax=Oryza punctata TaxID=4537 RepID=A0A0E0MG78_ORYPU
MDILTGQPPSPPIFKEEDTSQPGPTWAVCCWAHRHGKPLSSRLGAHYANALAAFDNPLNNLHCFPYYGNYVSLSRLVRELLERYAVAAPPARVAFVGSGPLPFSSLVLAARHMAEAVFDNYDVDGAGEEAGARARMSFRTADISDLRDEL